MSEILLKFFTQDLVHLRNLKGFCIFLYILNIEFPCQKFFFRNFGQQEFEKLFKKTLCQNFNAIFSPFDFEWF
jgi:hypothetical protein